jgi:hypothetical protein
MLEWNIEVVANIGLTAPSLIVLSDEKKTNITLSAGTSIIEFTTPDSGQLILDFYSKKEADTIVDSDGKIIKDTQWRITKIWCDQILLESWFMHSCLYEPRYFTGFLKMFPEAPLQIHSPYQFNFPGNLSWYWSPEIFWEWYRIERTNHVHLENMDIDLHRWEKFVGSPELYPELVAEIKELIHAS